MVYFVFAFFQKNDTAFNTPNVNFVEFFAIKRS